MARKKSWYAEEGVDENVKEDEDLTKEWYGTIKNANAVYIRKKPDMGADTIGILGKTDKVKVLNGLHTTNGFYPIEHHITGEKGYVRSDFLKVV